MLRFSLLALCVLTAHVAADDKTDRERKAKVALALAGQKPKPATAPAPRVAVPGYGAGYAKSMREQQPLVVFVGCRGWEVEGAVVTRAEGPFAGTPGPAVVVGFPAGDRLVIDATVTPDPEKVAAAVKSAQRKIDVPPKKDDKPAAPKPLRWDV